MSVCANLQPNVYIIRSYNVDREISTCGKPLDKESVDYKVCLTMGGWLARTDILRFYGRTCLHRVRRT